MKAATRTRIVLLILLACLVAPAARADRGATIYGGKGVGNYQLGRKWEPYSKQLGKPTTVKQSEMSDDARMLYYKQFGMYFFVKKDTVNGITVESPLFATPEGIKVGSDRNEVIRAYGNPQNLRSADVVYPERGLGFTFQGPRVARIYVMDKEDRDLASGDRRIVPGVRVGGIQLGGPVDFVTKHWKNPSKRAPFPNKEGSELWSYQKRGVIIVAYKGRVDGVWIFSPEFRTIRDVHVGSKRDDVVRAYGNPKSREENMEVYPDSGLGFFYEKNIVKQIFVRDTK